MRQSIFVDQDSSSENNNDDEDNSDDSIKLEQGIDFGEKHDSTDMTRIKFPYSYDRQEAYFSSVGTSHQCVL